MRHPILLLFLILINKVYGNCPGKVTRFGLPWDQDLISLSIKRFTDAYPEVGNFDGCQREDFQMPKLATRWNYTVESHEVVTKDGYILKIHRLPHGRNSKNPTTKNKPVVLFQHGILMSSSAWTSESPENSAAFIFADNGFDVWLANSRGNVHAQDHVDPNKNVKDFWDFSFDQMAEFDLPATFDKIQEVTGQEKLWYVGHSQGVTIVLAKLATDPKFHKRVHGVFALSPVTDVQNVEGTIPTVLQTQMLMDLLRDFYFKEGEMQVPSLSGEMMLLSSPMCLFMPITCAQVMFLLVGESEQYNETNSLTHVTITPEGTSLQNAWHWKQLYENGRFEKFDYDWREVGENQRRYGQDKPPVYDLANIKHTDFYVYSGADDQLANERDLQLFFNRLPNGVLKKHTRLESYSHIDFVWGTKTAKDVYWPIIKTIRKLELKSCIKDMFPFS